MSGQSIEIKISADPENVAVARTAIGKAAKQGGLSEEAADNVMLAIAEALTNVIRHGYGEPCEHEIILTVRKLTAKADGRAGMEFVIRDFGKQVDPASIKSRNLDEIRPGGLGVHIIRSVMDEVEYGCAEGKGMRLRMVKYLADADCSEADQSSKQHEGSGPRV